MSNWKQNLTKLLQMHGNYPHKKWYDDLSTWARKWAAITTEHGYQAHVSSRYPYEVVITAKPKGMSTTSFICELQYIAADGSEPVLSVKSVKNFNYSAYMKAIVNNPSAESEDLAVPNYVWDQFECDGEEIFHEEYVIETVNIAFQKYLEFRANIK